MKFISAGHCTTKGPNYDPGAPGVNGRNEAYETVKLRDEVIKILTARGFTDIVQDANGESLSQYLTRIKPGSGSVVIEFHFNAGPASATGTEVLIEIDGDKMDKACAKEFSDATARILGIKNRGVKTEADTRHKRLALMKEDGIICLVEVCFISSATDMAAYDKNFYQLAAAYADIIGKYDAMLA